MKREGGDSPKSELSQRVKEEIASGFSDGRKLYGDSFNMWNRLRMIKELTEGDPKNIHRLEPLPHYRQFYDEAAFSDGEKRFTLEYIDHVMELSDPAAVAAFDQLVDEYNADFERIKKESDLDALNSFVERGKALIYQKG